MNPKELFELFLGKERGEAIQDLEISQRAKGPLTQAEDATLRKFSTAADVAYAAASTLFTLPICFTINQAHKLVALPPPHRLLMLGYSAGGACVIGKLAYYQCLYGCAIDILKNGEERMKMELANMCGSLTNGALFTFIARQRYFILIICFIYKILTKHSNEKKLVKAVKKHFIAEHLFSDHHQDGPLFSWRQRHSYVDNSFVEREKETEANNSTGARSISGQTIVDTIEKDPLACIGSPDINKLSVDKSTILTRQQLQAHRS
ncbi:hypothetical protein CFC21_073412 [Triticum aestivum]|uniref:Uncharacterized protein n=3 Tax=Triticum TaxID=4564 RepID=A0A9R0XGZ1_TRITD|nr:hypothetical protein CFC21_073412 [Triticum aestivum]VAI36328.1 unnamed protein product [Triticum turgidum subsp. durum]